MARKKLAQSYPSCSTERIVGESTLITKHGRPFATIARLRDEWS